jgi:hypothetical protein
MNADLFREDRLSFWDRLIRGVHVPPEECEGLLARLVHDDCPDENRIGCILLLASVGIASDGTKPMRRNLRAALRYWFSHTGTKDRPENLEPRDLLDAGLEDVIGLYLNWPEAMGSVEGNKIDYTAKERIEKQIRARCAKEWKKRFGSSAPREIYDRR